MAEPIHLCDCAQQPDIRIACDQSWTTPAWVPVHSAAGIEGVYKSEEGRFYTFDEQRVTCPKCSKLGV